ncbi:MAG: hypothetical protein K0Q50_2258 [Vampirovibrio sp.]|jgi:hypothetical protein|nr:hypothetical protein [Vampirovibrio sp.]
MPPKHKSGELPKPIIQRGQFGCLPLNALTVSYMALGHSRVILGFRDTAETEAFKQRPTVQVQTGKQKESLSLNGKFFNGYSDALYRGCLPEVILAAPSAEKLSDFLKDFVEYMGKVLAMGFFMPKKHIIQRDPVEDLIPCTILYGNGLLFSQFVTRLVRELKGLEHEHPELNDAMRLKVLGRFVRSVPAADEESLFTQEDLAVLSGRSINVLPVPRHIRIAGGNRQTQRAIQDVLSAHGLITIIENQVHNPVERLEFENALRRISTMILPTMAERKLVTAMELKKLAVQIEQGILRIGQKRMAFEETETLSSGKPAAKSKASSVKSTAKKEAQSVSRSGRCLGIEDLAILTGLSHYAETLGLNEEQQLFRRLATQVEVSCQD